MGNLSQMSDKIRTDTYKAMESAITEFEKYLTKCGYDVAYWDLRLTAWGLSMGEFKPLWKIVVDLREGK